MSVWRSTSECKCPEKVMTQSRRIITAEHGKGKKCGPLQRAVNCIIKCAKDCKQGEFGYNCEDHNCVAGPWKDPGKPPCKEHNCKAIDAAKSKQINYYRKRKVIVKNKGKGKPCPHLTEVSHCWEYACDNSWSATIKYWLGL